MVDHRGFLWRQCLVALSGLTFMVSGAHVEQFREELTIKPLPDGKVASKFTFSTLSQGATPRNPLTLGRQDQAQHYSVFPLALGQIIREYGVSELHLSLNAGQWDYNRWGVPAELSVSTGAELWAWFGDGGPLSVEQRWIGLRNALAGLFCASLGSLDTGRTTSPELSFKPEGDLPRWGIRHRVRHAYLPSEHVCTENLTPFLKLLPCKSQSGLAALLNPHRLFAANWHGMGVHVLWHQERGVEIRLTFQSVMDPLRPPKRTKRNWSLSSLFDRRIERQCPVAYASEIHVALPAKVDYTLTPELPASNETTAVFDVLSSETPIDIAMNWETEFRRPAKHEFPRTPLSIHRTLGGSDQARGQLSVTVINHSDHTQDVLYLESVPWLLQFHLHTLRTRINGTISDEVISDTTYIPAVPRGRPTTFQSFLTIPSNSVLHLTVDVGKAFLRYTEHPPDAQRGWDLPPAVFTPLQRGKNLTAGEAFGSRIYTSALLVDPATPDFSMPYNVIIFTCSLIAFLFGSIFNLLTRKFVIVSLDSGKRS